MEKRVSKIEQEERETSHVVKIVSIKTKQKKWTEALNVNGHEHTFRLDTGADC